MFVQIGVLKENETAKERTKNRARQNNQRLHRENQKNKGLHVQE